jgi:hypothetical protein
MNHSNDDSELLREARSIKSEAENTVKRVEEQHQLYLNGLVGNLTERAMNDRKEAERCLYDTDRNVRIVGLEILLDVWQSRDLAFRATCERMILHDPDEEVRAVAINCLAKCYEGTNDSRVAQFLANLVRDDILSAEVRTAAYFGLLIVTGELGRRPQLILDFAFPESVDWGYVETVKEKEWKEKGDSVD